jgi:hypothetical protein
MMMRRMITMTIMMMTMMMMMTPVFCVLCGPGEEEELSRLRSFLSVIPDADGSAACCVVWRKGQMDVATNER